MSYSEGVWEILQAPFGSDEIESRQGGGGRTLSYVELPEYFAKIDAAVHGDWSVEYSVIPTPDPADGIAVKCRLTIQGVVREGIGQELTKYDKGGVRFNDQERYKNAETDSFKRACRMHGIGLHLWDKGWLAENTGAPSQQRTSNPQQPQDGQQRAYGPRADGDTITATVGQVKKIFGAAMGQLHLTGDQVRGLVHERYNVNPDELTFNQAVNLIEAIESGKINTDPNHGVDAPPPNTPEPPGTYETFQRDLQEGPANRPAATTVRPALPVNGLGGIIHPNAAKVMRERLSTKFDWTNDDIDSYTMATFGTVMENLTTADGNPFFQRIVKAQVEKDLM